MMAGNTLHGATVLPPMSTPRAAAIEAIDTKQKSDNSKTRKSSNSQASKNAGNRWQTLNEFVDVTLKHLRPAEAKVWMVLFRDSRNGLSKVAQTHIAERCGIARESVSRAIKELERKNLVKTVRHGGVNRGLSWYQLRSSTRTEASNSNVTLTCDLTVKPR